MKHRLYHWSGKRRLTDTILPGKRVVVSRGGQTRRCPFDIRRWIMPPDDELMCETWQKIARQHRRQLAATAQRSSDAKAKAVWHFIVEKIRFAADPTGADFWQLPPETLVLARGDCEDKSFLAASLLLAAGLPADRVRVVIGAVVKANSGNTRPLRGHAWPMYRSSRGTWCILETNLKHLPIQAKSKARRSSAIKVPRRSVGINQAVFLPADRLAADGRRYQYVPFVCLNHRQVWTVEPSQPDHVAAARALHPDWGQKPTFGQLLKHGRWLATRAVDPQWIEELLSP